MVDLKKADQTVTFWRYEIGRPTLFVSVAHSDSPDHRCDKRLQRLPKILCKRVYYFVNVYLNKNHMSETKQNYDGCIAFISDSESDEDN